MNRCVLHSASLFYPTDCGSSDGLLNCSRLSGNCIKCARPVKWTRDLFCVNSCVSCRGFAPCRSKQCGKCFILDLTVHFPIKRVEYAAENKASNQDQERLENGWAPKHQKANDFKQARGGDHLQVPYECMLCVFWKLRGRDPTRSNPQDHLLQACITREILTRAILDAFWSRAEGTVTGYAQKAEKMVEFLQLVGLEGPFKYTQQLLWSDHCGYEVAIEILLYSRREGKNTDHLQYDTIRSF